MNRHQRRAQEARNRHNACVNVATDLKKLVDLAEEKEGQIANITLHGWRFTLSMNNYGRKAPDGSNWWHLGASLQPIGRSSTSDDWRFLGQAIAHLGVKDPDKALVTPFDTTPPNAVHHWTWTDTGCPEVVEIVRHAIDHMYPERDKTAVQEC